MRIIIILGLVLSFNSASAATIEKVDFKDSLTQEGTDLVLNGVGLRTKTKLGIDFRVYVAGLYLKTKTKDAEKVIGDGETKLIEMAFLRSLDRKQLVEAWTEQLTQNCRVECDKLKTQMQPFLDSIDSVKDGVRSRLLFDKKGLSSNGKRIDDPALATNVLAVFFGAHPPTEQLKKGLLGL